jgi:pimeloyl-ACP methyl ester carboxylesterase
MLKPPARAYHLREVLDSFKGEESFMEAHVNGIKLNYEVYGQGTAMLLVHAFPLNHTMWQPQVEALSDVCQLITPDMRGFGRSEVPEGPYTMDVFADDLAGLLDTLNIQQVILAGLSMGGYIAFAFLRRHAARVQALVLADTRATADTEQAREGRETNAQLVERQGPEAIADMMLPNLISTHASAELRTHLRTVIRGNHPAGIASALRGMALRPDSTSLLSQINVPTLLLVGNEDTLTAPGEMQDMQQAIAGSKLVEIPNAAHIANLENPTAFHAALRDFVQSL